MTKPIINVKPVAIINAYTAVESAFQAGQRLRARINYRKALVAQGYSYDEAWKISRKQNV